jgi:hypothetical protein
MKIRLLFWVFLAIVVCAFSASTARADSANGTLWYTTFGPNHIGTVNYSYDGVSTFTLSGNTTIANPTGADGILFAPDGHLIVSGQNAQSPPNLHEYTTAGVFVTDKSAGDVGTGMGSYHMALSSNANNAILYNTWNGPGTGPTSISATVLSGGGLSVNGTNYAVSIALGHTGSTDVRGLAFDPINNKWYYGTAGDGLKNGDFGTVVFDNTLHTAILTPILPNNVQPSHGLSFDPFTNTVIMNSADTISQFDPVSGTIVSSVVFSGQQFDQAAEDGKGHLFAASNFGNLAFVDYDNATGGGGVSHFIGGSGNFTNIQFLASTLDDIAPLSGPGSPPVPEPSTMILLGSGLIGLAGFARRKFKK